MSTISTELLENSVCPNCWTDFKVADVKWVSGNEDLFGDYRLGEGSQQRFTPTRFDINGFAIDVRGTSCQEIACPSCHLKIPRSVLVFRPFFLSIAGTPSCGKSFYLASLAWQLRKVLPNEFGLHISDSDGECNKILNDYEEQLFFNDGKDNMAKLAKTDVDGDWYNEVLYENQSVRYTKPFYFDVRPVQSMINALRVGIGEDQDLSKRRYDKVIIMTDADVDGSHIRTLLLCFFYRQMYHMIEAGHVYVAQPPLFRVKNKSKTYYVQSEEEMRRQLLDRGLVDTSFEGDDNIITGDQMRKLCSTLASVEEAVLALERRGINLKTHANRMDLETGKLPVFHVTIGSQEYWFSDRKSMDNFIKQQETETGQELTVETDGSEAEDTDENDKVRINEFYEVKTINAGLKELEVFGFNIDALMPKDRTGIEEPRYILRKGDNETPVEDLRGLVNAVRAAGEKGMHVTRFKGLGEMNAEELRETTLDPNNRTLIKVKMDNAAEADNMFRILMGDKVEPRREFIEKYALDISELDV